MSYTIYIEFFPDSLLSEINAIDNLMALCPNHHWELDNHLLSL
ncbi:MAG: HNH endonuclease [Anaerolineales bacterium]|nr:HNH endonuclease [Anaerolineales bacterium]